MSTFRYYFLMLLSLLSLTAGAESFHFSQYEVSDGLPSNAIRCIIQDHKGFLWFGTGSGLSRFDGYSFRNFNNIEGDKTSIHNNYSYTLYEDNRKQLWIGTDNGVSLYHENTECFSFFSAKTSNGTQIKSCMSCILQTKDGTMWFATLGQGIFSYQPQSKKLVNYSHLNKQTPLDNDSIGYLCIDKQGTLWAASLREGTLTYFDQKSQRFVTLPLHEKGNSKISAMYALLCDYQDQIWVGTWDKGIALVNKSTGEITSFVPDSKIGGIGHIHYIYEYKRGMLLIGSDDGLLSFNTHTHEFKEVSLSEKNGNSLAFRFIYPIYKDREGGLWIGSYYDGVSYSSPGTSLFEGFEQSSFHNSVNGNVISKFCEDNQGNLWIGSDDGGLSCMNKKTHLFTHYLPDGRGNGISYHNIHALCLDNDNLWVGTYSGGLNKMNLQTHSFKHYLPSQSIYALKKDRYGNLWAGSMSDIMIYDRQKDDFRKIVMTNTTTTDILDAPDGNLYFGTLGQGIYIYNFKTRKWLRLKKKADMNLSLPCNQINTLCNYEGKEMWVGTDDGLWVYNYNKKSFKKLHIEGFNQAVCSIIYQKGLFWLATTNGIAVYNPKTKSMRRFYKRDGLQSDQFSVCASLLSSDGKIYFGSINGFNVIDPQVFPSNQYVPPVMITNLQIFNKDVPIDSKGTLKQSINVVKQIELSYKQNVFSIEYAALSYSAPYKNRYKYKLEGFDKEWNDVGNERKATYTNLPAGHYVFRVIASNNDGLWDNDGAQVKIVIHPPFWQTTGAYFLYVLLILGGVYGTFKFLQRRSERRQEEKIHRLKAEKEQELYEAKINFFTLIAHEIRTPVTLIIGPMEKIMNGLKQLPENIQDDMQIINRNSQRLLSLINQLLDFRKAEENAFVIHFVHQSVYELLQNLYVRFLPMMEQRGIHFAMNMDNRQLIADLDEEAMTKVVSNLLTNALKYAKDDVELTCTADEQHLVIKVSDNGPGIPIEEQQKIFEPFYQAKGSYRPGTGLGLALSHLLVEAHHGMIEVNSTPDQPTVFTITTPLHQKNVEEKKTKEPMNDELVSDSNVASPNKVVHETSAANLPVLLIVEDDEDMSNFLYENFSDSYNVITAVNGEEGLEALSKHPADLIISDIMMPVMDGLTFCNKVKEDTHLGHIPIVLLTAKTDNMSKVEGMNSGADAYVEKPFSIQVLMAQIANLLDSRRKLRKKFSEMPLISDDMAENKADEKFLNQLNKLIEDNISNSGFSIDDLADGLGCSRSGLFSKIKSLSGMTPGEIIQIVRLKKAAALLSTGKYRINEICYQVGFNSPSYFSRCFFKQFGKLPKDYINKE